MAYLRDTALLGRWGERRIDRAAKFIGVPETVGGDLARPQSGSKEGLRARAMFAHDEGVSVERRHGRVADLEQRVLRWADDHQRVRQALRTLAIGPRRAVAIEDARLRLP